MEKRESLFAENFFFESIRYSEAIIASRAEKLRLQPDVYKKPQTFKYATFGDRYRLIFLEYSVGSDLKSMSARFPACVDAYEDYLRCEVHEETDFSSLDDYLISLWLLNFALIFEVEDELVTRLLKCIGNEGRDSLFEKLVSTRVAGRKPAVELAFPTIFDPLARATVAAAAERERLIRQYLESWYKAMKSAYWHDAHKGPDGGGFFGYWAMEVAGVVKAFKVDDAAFRNMRYYPRDLIK